MEFLKFLTVLHSLAHLISAYCPPSIGLYHGQRIQSEQQNEAGPHHPGKYKTNTVVCRQHRTGNPCCNVWQYPWVVKYKASIAHWSQHGPLRHIARQRTRGETCTPNADKMRSIFRYDLNQANAEPRKPKRAASRLRNISHAWSIVSKAMDRSTNNGPISIAILVSILVLFLSYIREI